MREEGQAAGRQSSSAKHLWGRSITRERKAIFPFDRFPALVAAVGEHLPERALILLLGGGRGYLGSLLTAPGRTALNLDIAPGAGPFVPSVIADMESPLPVRPDRVGGEVVAVAAFALEYTDVRLSTSRLADVLVSRERFVWLCHHSDSYILRDLRAGRSASRVAAQVVRHAETGMAPDALCALPADLAARARADGDPAREVEVARLNELATEIAARPAVADQARGKLAALARRLAREAEMSDMVASRTMRAPEDLIPLVDARLAPRLGGCVSVDGQPLGILVVFERR